jgi:hypothetical protein
MLAARNLDGQTISLDSSLPDQMVTDLLGDS